MAAYTRRMPTPKILAFAGSAREASLNKKLVRTAAQMAREAGAEVTLLDLRDHPLPIYDGDFEQSGGVPAGAMKLKQIFKQHQGFLWSCPEYNSSVTPLLKNTIDWLSRPVEGEGRLECFTGKVACLLSASPGGFGGMRGLVTVRSILENIGTMVISESVSVPKAHEAFEEDGSLKDEALARRTQSAVARLVEVAGAVGITTA